MVQEDLMERARLLLESLETPGNDLPSYAEWGADIEKIVAALKAERERE